MSDALIQHNFSSGELSPSLFARTDLQKYRAGAALMRNWFVDYRGGASTRCGTRYSLQARNSANPVRLISFSASFTVTFALEFGQNYIRFHTNGGPVLEATTAISGASQANPASITDVAHGYATGDWVFITGVGGMTQLNGRYFIVTRTGANTYTLADLNGVNIDSTGYTAYTAGGTAARVYTLQSPYAASDLGLLKFAQNVSQMVLCHPSYVPYILTYNTATSWTLSALVVGATVAAPTISSVTGSNVNNNGVASSWMVTSVDSNGQESEGSAAFTIINSFNPVSSPGNSYTVVWAAIPGAVSYNVYRTQFSQLNSIPAGASYGFVGSTTGTTYIDNYSQVNPNFSLTPPIKSNPFVGGGVQAINITAAGVYGTVPSITIAAASSGAQATGHVSLKVITIGAIANGGTGYVAGNTVPFAGGVSLIVATTGGGGAIVSFQPLTYPGTNAGSVTGAGTSVPANPLTSLDGKGAQVNLTWGVGQGIVDNGASGYDPAAPPAVTFSAGAATATTTVAPTAAGNPAVPSFTQQRLVLAAPTNSLQTFFMSKTGAPYTNFDVSNPLQADDAITATIVSPQLNAIKSLIPVPAGLIAMTSRGAWVLNGGNAGAVITPIDITAQAQAYNGANDVPPIVANYDILYVQSKGSIVRDLTYNFYANIFTGTDISVLSNHLFFGLSINEWAWAEEPFKIVWAVRSDGVLLALTFLKEQEIYGWAHSDTKGLFKSVCAVTEATTNGNVDAIYVVVQRIIGGNTVQYIERMADRFFPYGLEDAWALDAAVQSVAAGNPGVTLNASSGAVGAGVTFTASSAIFNAGEVGWVLRMGGGIATITGFTSSTVVTGTITQAITAITPNDPLNTPLPALPGTWSLWTPATVFSGLDHLNGQTVTALADGVAVTGLVVTNGSITLPNPATKVVAGIPFTPQLQPMYLDSGEPTIQGKRKKIGAVTLRVRETRGLKVGRLSTTLVSIKESGPPILVASGLVSADERVIMDPLYDVPGQLFIQQDNPMPATVLGLIPEIAIGDK